jgi:hypothetical protein
METYIKLSWWQRWKLRKFFKGVEDANIADDDAAIGAQIWKDGMHVRLFNAERGKALSSALGGRWDDGHSSMASKRNSATTKP